MNTSNVQFPASVAMKYELPKLPPEPTPVVLAALFRLYAIAGADDFDSAVIRRQLEEIALHLPCESIPGSDGSIYLRRFLVAQMTDGSRIYLHNILRSDEDLELHNHPRRIGRALILVDGYSEQRRELAPEEPLGFKVVTKVYEPGMTNLLDADTFHRLSLICEDSWSLMFVSEKAVRPEGEDSWSFWCPATGKITGYKEFLATKAARLAYVKSLRAG